MRKRERGRQGERERRRERWGGGGGKSRGRVKTEAANNTGSRKDGAMVVAVVATKKRSSREAQQSVWLGGTAAPRDSE